MPKQIVQGDLELLRADKQLLNKQCNVGMFIFQLIFL